MMEPGIKTQYNINKLGKLRDVSKHKWNVWWVGGSLCLELDVYSSRVNLYVKINNY